MCLPSGRASLSEPVVVKCVCGDGQTLNPDGKTCTKSTGPTPKPTTEKPEVTTPKPVTEKPGVTTSKPETTAGGETTVVPVDGSTKEATGHKEPQNVGSVALTAGIVAAVLIIIVLVVSLLLTYKVLSNKI